VKGETAAEIHRQLISVYGEDVMYRQNVANLCREFKAGRSDVHDESHPLLLMKSSQKIDENIRADRLITIDELHQHCPEVSRTVLRG
jgi:acetolactate synthase small subunit